MAKIDERTGIEIRTDFGPNRPGTGLYGPVTNRPDFEKLVEALMRHKRESEMGAKQQPPEGHVRITVWAGPGHLRELTVPVISECAPEQEMVILMAQKTQMEARMVELDRLIEQGKTDEPAPTTAERMRRITEDAQRRKEKVAYDWAVQLWKRLQPEIEKAAARGERRYVVQPPDYNGAHGPAAPEGGKEALIKIAHAEGFRSQTTQHTFAQFEW